MKVMQQISESNITSINYDDKRYPRPKWFQLLRSVVVNSVKGFYVIFFLYALVFIYVSLLVFVEIIIQKSSLSVVIAGAILVFLVGIYIHKAIPWMQQDGEHETLLLRERVRKQQPHGLRLRCTLIGHQDYINIVKWSPTGDLFASSSDDKHIILWDTEAGKPSRFFQGHTGGVLSITWSPNGHALASSSNDSTVKLWDTQTGQTIKTLRGHLGAVRSVAWSPDGLLLASGSNDLSIRLWNPQTGQTIKTLRGHLGAVRSVAWSPDGLLLASSSNDGTIRLWNVTGQHLKTLKGHSSRVTSIAWSPDGLLLASSSADHTIRLWDPQTGSQKRILEGHIDEIRYVAFSFDGHLLASKSDRTTRIWRTDTWEMSTILDMPPNVVGQEGKFSDCLTFHPKLPQLATLGEGNTVIRIWDVDIDTILNSAPVTPSMSYTNAKIILVGDSGVGKSGLGLVLAGEKFVPTTSTHARHVWTFDNQEVEINGHKETREILLWDLAGQPGYRIIHQLYLNEVVVALVVFDAHHETDPFAGIWHWNRALRQAQLFQGYSALPLKKFLVAARTDRGGIGVSQERIQAIMGELGFDAYFETSAKEGWGISELQTTIREAIHWEALPKVSSTKLFQHIKNFLIAEKIAREQLLSSIADLYRTFLHTEHAPPGTENLSAQFETCIGRLEAVGLIKRLSFGKLTLLQPELLDVYASALINAVKDEPDGLGSIIEERVRTGNFRISENERLKDKEQEKLLLIAMVEDLLRQELALREEPFLVFPSQSTRDHPNMPDPEGKRVIFELEGPILNIYATLAVRLSYSGLFKKKELWRNAVTYTANVGGTCGMFLYNTGEGHGTLTLFFDKEASEETKLNFEEYVQIHLQRRALPETLKRRRVFTCECGATIPEQIIQLRRERGFDWLNCPVCNTQLSLLDREERLVVVPSASVIEMDRAADTQRDIEANKSTIQGKQETQDFDVFLCHNTIDKPAVKRIGEQLKERGILPWLDEWELRPGLPWQRILEEQIGHIKAAAVFVGRDGIGPWQRHEIEAFLREFNERGCPVIPVILADAPNKPKLPIFLQNISWVDYSKDADPMERLVWGITGKRGDIR